MHENKKINNCLHNSFELNIPATASPGPAAASPVPPTALAAPSAASPVPPAAAPDLRLATTDNVAWPELTQYGITIDTLRLDKIHPIISGNKWFKLHHYLSGAADRPGCRLITFGGAWSNHIIAAAYAAKEAGIPVTGIIRGERPAVLSGTLRDARSYGMELEFISRDAYRQKDSPAFLEALSLRSPNSLLIPEGGAGKEGIQGSEEILQLTDKDQYTHILCAIGTGTMYQGLIKTASPKQTVIGIPVLKGFHDQPGFDTPPALAADRPATPASFPAYSPVSRIAAGYHFGGYARKNPILLDFMNQFYKATGIPTDFVYTAKLFFAALDMTRKAFFPPGSRLLVIHSGGLQGNQSLPENQLIFRPGFWLNGPDLFDT